MSLKGHSDGWGESAEELLEVGDRRRSSPSHLDETCWGLRQGWWQWRWDRGVTFQVYKGAEQAWGRASCQDEAMRN